MGIISDLLLERNAIEIHQSFVPALIFAVIAAGIVALTMRHGRVNKMDDATKSMTEQEGTRIIDKATLGVAEDAADTPKDS